MDGDYFASIPKPFADRGCYGRDAHSRQVGNSAAAREEHHRSPFVRRRKAVETDISACYSVGPAAWKLPVAPL
jgi:hypothetical protein